MAGKNAKKPRAKPEPNPIKALDILEAMILFPGGAGVTELADRTQMSKSSVYRILTALTERNFVVKDDNTKTYVLGLRLLNLTGAILDSLEIKKTARMDLRNIAEATGETVHLIRLDDLEGVYIDKIETINAIGLKSQIGKRIPLYCTAGGKAILANMPNDYIKNYINTVSLVGFTGNTYSTPESLLAELAKIRDQGYAIDNEEHHKNITCIGVPILSGDGRVIASISVSAPTYRFPLAVAIGFRDLLIDAARNIQHKLGS